MYERLALVVADEVTTRQRIVAQHDAVQRRVALVVPAAAPSFQMADFWCTYVSGVWAASEQPWKNSKMRTEGTTAILLVVACCSEEESAAEMSAPQMSARWTLQTVQMAGVSSSMLPLHVHRVSQ